jgi:hypothetical protein
MKATSLGLLVALLATSVLGGCSSRIQGTYTDPTGAFVLELKSGNSASFAFSGQAAPCTYQSAGSKINLQCQGQADTLVLTVQNDGSLTGPPGTFLPPLRKK